MKKFFLYHINSFRYAFSGLPVLFSERNAKIHAIATVLVIAVGIWREIGMVRWGFLLVAIGLVWICEAFNTAIEKLCNVVSEQYHPVIKQVKDISSAAVLISAVLAVLTGILVFFIP